ncbi:MAG TPA: DUF5519 family protein [Aggregatilineales bacterium]|nr:DUF5519 family protein [Anaerolineales bacterium]HRE46743.1 DUF5519 family protein [Aggregatilineales bacterium]
MPNDLISALTTIRETVGGWEGVSAAPHRFGGTEFRLGAVELGHFHRNGMVDILFSRAIREALLAEGRAEAHHLLPKTGWISFYIREEGDSERALWLFQLAYVQKRIKRDRVIHADVKTMLAHLNLSDSMRPLIAQDKMDSTTDAD